MWWRAQYGMIRFIGIDYSMTSPAVTIITADSFTSHFFAQNKKQEGNAPPHFYSYSYPTHSSLDIDRYSRLTNWVMSLANFTEYDIICIEGYSMGSVGAVFSIAENTAILKNALYLNNIKYHVVAPTTLKKYATGKGNADKLQMYERFTEKTKTDPRKVYASQKAKLGSPFTDIADSYWLADYSKNIIATNYHL
jgi:hypothetical protein